MNIADIRLMFDYNYWANYLLLDAAEKLTPEQFTAPTSHSFSSLQATFVHTLDTEMGWRNIVQGLGFAPDLLPADFPDVAALRQNWQQDEQAMRAYLDSLTDADMSFVVRYTTPSGILRERVLWHCLYHVVNHGMQHRAEAAAILTDFGQSPGEIDFTIFLNGLAAK